MAMRLPGGVSHGAPVALALALVACSTSGPVPSGPSAAPPASAPGGAPAVSASAASPMPLRHLEVPTATISATSAPLWIGVDYGFFQRHGFDVEVKGLAPA